MTRKQKQALLSYLGAYDGPLDGIWGDRSRQATIDFQRAYMDSVDGIGCLLFDIFVLSAGKFLFFGSSMIYYEVDIG